MNFNDYQTKSRVTAKYPAIGHGIIYPTLGLVNEAGEVAGKIKKVFRDKDGVISAETREALKAELGDVLWYWPRSARNWACPWTRWPSTTSPSCMTVSSAESSEEMGTIASPENTNFKLQVAFA